MEIGIASAFGAVIGLSIAITLDLPRWLWFPCGLVAFFCYRPYEIYVVIRGIAGELWQALCIAIRSARHLPNLSTSINWGKVRKVTIVTLQVLCLMEAVWTGAAYADLLIYLTALHQPQGLGEYIFLIPFVSVVIAALCAWITLFLLIEIRDTQNRKLWVLPLTSKFVPFLDRMSSPSVKEEKVEKDKKEPFFPLKKWDLLGFSTILLFAPLLAHLFFVFTLALFLMDLAITLILACASSERLASIEGGTLGCAAGALATYAGVPYGVELLIAGGLVGLITGPYLYALRLNLGKAAQAAPIT